MRWTSRSHETYDDGATALLWVVTDFANVQTTNVYNAAGNLAQMTGNGATYWAANNVDAEGHLTEETAGGGAGTLVTQRSFDAYTGHLATVIAGTNGQGNNVVNFEYDWDSIGNLTSRTDTLQNYDENFCYDSLNRLVNYALIDGGGTSCTAGTIVKSIGYDANLPGGIGDGNITAKSDIGGYAYGQNAGPHALTSINTSATGGCTLSSCKVDGVSSPNFYYDPDGNMLCVTTKLLCDGTAARSYSWTSFDMAETIVNGANRTSFGYTPEHQRGALTTAAGTLYYFSNPAAGVFNELAPDGATWHSYVAPYGHIVAELFTGGASQTYYFVGDHLVSTTALTDATTGTQKEYDSYDAWGNRRNASGTDYPTGCFNTHPSSLTLRGYTSQEEMDNLCLVNLNARLYDPALGRVLSADPTIPGALNGQAFNRYSYVTNNPLTLTDPSGLIPDDPLAEPLILPIDGSYYNAVEAITVTGHRDQNIGGPGGMSGGEGITGFGSGGGYGGDILGPVETVVVTGHRLHTRLTPLQLANLLLSQISLPSIATGDDQGPNGFCSARLPNGQTVGQVVQQQRAALMSAEDQALQADQSSPDGAGPGFVTGAFLAIALPGGPIDFKNNFKGRDNAATLGQEGNFAYYSIGSGILPTFELDAGAGAYGLLGATLGQKSFSKLKGPMYSDASAASQRDAGLASGGCVGSSK